jgi:uncharacterized protein YcaQ
MGRASDTEKAERLNRARGLLRQFKHLPDAVEHLAHDCSISPRQAYRYLQHAQRLKEPVGRGRNEGGLYGETAAQFDSARAVVRICQKTLDQRSGQPCVARAAATRARSWLSQSRSYYALFSWSIVSIAYCRKSSPKPIRFWCRINVGRSQAQSPSRTLRR